jgi:nucleoside-diphosphate kinase
MCYLSYEDAAEFYACHRDREFYSRLCSFMSSGRIVALELQAPDAIAKWRALIGPTNSNTAREQAPESLRARFGTDGTMNACHGSDAPETAEAESAFFFSGRRGPCHYAKSSTLGIVKPSAVEKGLAGPILDEVMQRFHITALQLFYLDRANSAEFLEVYKVMSASDIAS